MEDMKVLNNEELEKVSGGAEQGAFNIIADRACAEIGKPYRWGTCGPDAYDASGLVNYALTGAYIRKYNVASFLSWPKVDDPQPGDICTNTGHCGIYIGGGRMVHAPTEGHPVCISVVPLGMVYLRP